MDESILLQKLLEVAIQVLVPILLGLVGVLVKEAWAWVKAHVDQTKLETAMAVIEALVKAAEQNGLKDELFKVGANKKAYVMDLAAAELAKHNIVLDLETLSAMVESAVYDEFGWRKLSDGQG
jgi:hypothetical protein